jgi:hypothetical protein
MANIEKWNNRFIDRLKSVLEMSCRNDHSIQSQRAGSFPTAGVAPAVTASDDSTNWSQKHCRQPEDLHNSRSRRKLQW